MDIEIKIDDSFSIPKIIVLTNKITEEVNEIVKRLSQEIPQVIIGFKGDTLEILEQNEIVRCYTASGKVYGVTSKGEYSMRLRLYELEERLDKKQFVRISNSEIINLTMVKSFDLSFAGTIQVSLKNGNVTYVSRRYVARIKQILRI